MPKTSYISTHGTIWGEISDAGVTRSYGHDALGSVTETFTADAIECTYRYKPYGGSLAKTGSATDPSFLWNGGSGYRNTKLQSADFYVLHRHYAMASCGWTTVDPTWPQEPPYGYAAARPTIFLDLTGMGPVADLEPRQPVGVALGQLSTPQKSVQLPLRPIHNMQHVTCRI